MASLLISQEVPACPQEGMCHLSVQQLASSATELLALNHWLWEGWKSIITKQNECVCQMLSVAESQDRRRCPGWDAGVAQQSGMQDAPRCVSVPACKTSRLWVKALWFMLLAAHLPLHLLNCSPLKLLQCFDPVSCQIAAMEKSHPG